MLISNYLLYLLVLSPQQCEVMIHSLEEALTEFVIKHELMDNLHLLLEGHPM